MNVVVNLLTPARATNRQPIALFVRAVAAIFVCGVTLLFAGGGDASAQSQTSPYCANFRNGARDCSFPTLQACQTTIRGVGGSCTLNPFSPSNPPRPNFWQRTMQSNQPAATTARPLVRGTYCAFTSDGGTNCGYPTMRACRTAISGVGGSCRRYTQ